MKVITKKLLRYLKDKNMTAADLAKDMGVHIAEVEKMLTGNTVGVNTARKFIRYFTADEAQALIDWEAIGKKNPLACEADLEQPEEDEDDEETEFLLEDVFDEQDNEDFDEDAYLEREHRRLNYDPYYYVEALVDLEDKYR